ncbi:hypothetical protein CC78DRAFT_586291 [Lojkania enalia]|uniref:Uncharacterized protein n=1 Tax=Lojkania enalia TaxID=147567 RepID=A0A9P4JYY8_9PLEO|nr:hypothetical protein CC78DRAFT_586291 [Didymosphaeria enalia]
MSTAKALYLQSCIAKKLRRDKNYLRKSIAHKNLCEKLQPFVLKAENRLPKSGEELDSATGGECAWLNIEWNKRIGSFEERIAISLGAERLAALTLDDKGEDCDLFRRSLSEK